jgi:DNA gyrase subunit A
MKFRNGDSLLAMSVVNEGTDPDVFVVFESGLAKRSKVSEWNVKGRGILGVAVAKQSDKGGDLVGALTVDEDDEVLVIFEKGNIVRSRVDEVRLTGRNTMGVQFAKPSKNDTIVAVARNPEREVEEAVEAIEAAAEAGTDADDTPLSSPDGDEAISTRDRAASGDADEPTDAVPSVDDEDSGGRE